MVIPAEKISEESLDADADDTDSVESESVEDLDLLTPPGLNMPPSPAHTAEKPKKGREHPYKGRGVVYLPGDINGLTKKLYLLAAEFFEGNTTVRNELVHVLDALLRLKQLTRKEYTDITARLAASL